jgi:hypothetical protein
MISFVSEAYVCDTVFDMIKDEEMFKLKYFAQSMYVNELCFGKSENEN